MALVEPFEADDGEIVAEGLLVVPGLGVEEDADEEVVTTGFGGVGGAEVVGEVEGVEFTLCAEEVDEPAVGGRVAPFGVTGFILQLFTSLKAGAPLLLVVGVRVTVQVCTIGPLGLGLHQ